MPFNLSEIFSNIANLFRWWIVIAPWEQAIRVRGGKTIRVLGPGINLRIPGLDRFFIQSVRKRYMNTPTQAVSTVDEKAVTVSGGVSYSIDNIGTLYDTLHNPEDVVAMETQAVVAKFIARTKIADCNPETIQEFVNANLDFSSYGLKDAQFFVTDFVAVKTYRIINSSPRDFMSGGGILDTTQDSR